VVECFFGVVFLGFGIGGEINEVVEIFERFVTTPGPPQTKSPIFRPGFRKALVNLQELVGTHRLELWTR
jgi:hypothetical protein